MGNIKKKLAIHLVILISFLFVTSKSIFAGSSYVLPYPAAMPGTFNYKIHRLYEELSAFWYFGDLGQFTYNLKLSDKYLVESKTLFEYKQYLLGYDALIKSNFYYSRINSSLESATSHGKDVSEKYLLFKSASQKHIEVLTFIKSITPEEFTWVPEKGEKSVLPIKNLIDKSILQRERFL